LSVRFRIEVLAPRHERSGFDCGVEPLNRYFHQQVSQDIRRRVTACFVAVAEGSGEIAGYYTLASASVALAELPEDVAKKLPRYPTVPAVRMGRLAIARAFAGQGLGATLLADALTRSLRAEIPAFALIVDAKDEQAAAFYRHHGFLALQSDPLTLFLPLATASRLASR
jgi:ribosomal protein S18 acetylase RimI-like enzyme